jgi:hypothetical protein
MAGGISDLTLPVNISLHKALCVRIITKLDAMHENIPSFTSKNWELELMFFL